MKVLNPADGEVVADLPEDDAASVATKYDRCRSVQPLWAATPMSERLEVLRRFRQEVIDRRDDLASILTSETGKPITQARNELDGTIPRLDFFLEHAESLIASETVLTDPAQSLTEVISHEPLGVIANVSAWNYPWFVGTNVFVPALLAGNGVLYKPSELAPLTGLAIADMFLEAGLPADVFQTVIGGGEVGAAVVDQPIDAVFFTGSYATGRRIAEAVAPRLVKVQLELGGKDPVYVCDDVDVVATAEALADGAFYNAGQSCCSVERIYVHEAVADEFVDAFVHTVKGFAIGDPTDERTYIGPITRAVHLEVLESQVVDAVAKGGQALVGGSRREPPGSWFDPTVIVGATHDMDLMREETFGPLIGIQVVADDAEALALMNDTEYGLTAAVYSNDRDRAAAILELVDAGSAYWNCCDRVSPRLPWSGRGSSGIGLTLSTYGIQAFTRPKAWHLRSP